MHSPYARREGHYPAYIDDDRFLTREAIAAWRGQFPSLMGFRVVRKHPQNDHQFIIYAGMTGTEQYRAISRALLSYPSMNEDDALKLCLAGYEWHKRRGIGHEGRFHHAVAIPPHLLVDSRFSMRFIKGANEADYSEDWPCDARWRTPALNDKGSDIFETLGLTSFRLGGKIEEKLGSGRPRGCSSHMLCSMTSNNIVWPSFAFSLTIRLNMVSLNYEIRQLFLSLAPAS